MEIGEHWAYREKPKTPGGSAQPVEVLQLGPKRSRKVRIRWLEGEYAGLDEWISALRLIVQWDDVQRFLDDENQMLALEAAQSDDLELVVAEAVRQVYFATDSPIEFDVHESRVRADIDDYEKTEQNVPATRDELLASPTRSSTAAALCTSVLTSQ